MDYKRFFGMKPRTCDFHSLFSLKRDRGISLGQHVLVCPLFVSNSTMAFSSLALTESDSVDIILQFLISKSAMYIGPGLHFSLLIQRSVI